MRIFRNIINACNEFFLTGTAAEVIGIVEIDGRAVGEGKPGPITKRLREKFFEYAHSHREQWIADTAGR